MTTKKQQTKKEDSLDSKEINANINSSEQCISEINANINLIFSTIIDILSKNIDELNKKLSEAEKLIKRLNDSAIEIDNNFDLSNRYGFTKDEMYYIGYASGRIYRRPINKTILKKIENIRNLDWKEIGEVGDYFMYGKVVDDENELNKKMSK